MSVLSMLAEPNIESGANIEVSAGAGIWREEKRVDVVVSRDVV
jgi:hypothetical protein